MQVKNSSSPLTPGNAPAATTSSTKWKMFDELLLRVMLQINKQNADIKRLSFKNSNHNKHEASETESLKVSISYSSSSASGCRERCAYQHVSIHVQLIKFLKKEKEVKLSDLLSPPVRFINSSEKQKVKGSFQLSCYSWVICAGVAQESFSSNHALFFFPEIKEIIDALQLSLTWFYHTWSGLDLVDSPGLSSGKKNPSAQL